MKNWLTRKDPDDGKDWRWEEKGMTEDEMVGWHYWLDGHEFEQAPGVGEGQGSLVCCGPWVAELDTTERLNWTEKIIIYEKLIPSWYVFFPIIRSPKFFISGIHIWAAGWICWLDWLKQKRDGGRNRIILSKILCSWDLGIQQHSVTQVKGVRTEGQIFCGELVWHSLGN